MRNLKVSQEVYSTKFSRNSTTNDTFQYWATLDGYKGEPFMEMLRDKDPSNGKTIEKYYYKEKGKPEVVLFKSNQWRTQ